MPVERREIFIIEGKSSLSPKWHFVNFGIDEVQLNPSDTMKEAQQRLLILTGSVNSPEFVGDNQSGWEAFRIVREVRTREVVLESASKE